MIQVILALQDGLVGRAQQVILARLARLARLAIPAGRAQQDLVVRPVPQGILAGPALLDLLQIRVQLALLD